MVEITNL
ncbi:hypothetical protein PENPOL_c030G09431 [Penicillium polonicum]|nr:hypothetical protein PENPOL_c030G09431 [Penicillium polonicum]